MESVLLLHCTNLSPFRSNENFMVFYFPNTHSGVWGRALSWSSARQMMIFSYDQRFSDRVAQCVGTLRLQSHHYHLLLWRGGERGQTNAEWSEGTVPFLRACSVCSMRTSNEVRSFVRSSSQCSCTLKSTRNATKRLTRSHCVMFNRS